MQGATRTDAYLKYSDETASKQSLIGKLLQRASKHWLFLVRYRRPVRRDCNPASFITQYPVVSIRKRLGNHTQPDFSHF